MTVRDARRIAARLPSPLLLALLGCACQTPSGVPDTPKPAASERKPPEQPVPAVKKSTSDSVDDPARAEKLPAIAPTSLHPFSPLDLLAMDRISDPQLSADGKNLVFVVRSTDMKADQGRTDLWRVSTDGGSPVQITTHPGSDHNPRISPDSKHVFFVSDRGGTAAVWRKSMAGNDARQVSDVPLPVANLELSPDGTRVAFTMEVFVECKDAACTKKRLDALDDDPSTGQLYNQLFVRHWDRWNNGRRNHLFTMPVGGGDPIDVTSGLDADVPSRPFGGTEEFTFSPDGKTLVFTAREGNAQEAWSTNFDLFTVPVQGGPRANLTDDNEAWDTRPTFSPDGKTLVWTAMKRPGYESDRFAIMARDLTSGKTREIAPDWDRSASEISFAPDGQTLLVRANDLGHVSLFKIGLADGAVSELVDAGDNAHAIATEDTVFYVHSDFEHPAELHAIPFAGGDSRAVTTINAAKVAAAKMGTPEQFHFKGAGGDTVYGYVVKPVDFEEGQRYPIAFLIHGGPQGSFANNFHYRWNPQVYAGAGYGVIMIDFHGSTGYGQRFTDAINGDWGGKPLTDLQRGLAAATTAHPWLDRSRACALGASFGGYMVNWIAGKWSDGFKCLVNHDGVFDQRMMYYATEELWFPEWEQSGPYYTRARAYEKHNPVSWVDRWKTPMLVIHGDLDYRIPFSQGLAAFTALQRRGVASRMLVFPNENHWVLAPANSVQWHNEILGWMNEHLAGDGEATP